MIQFGNDKIKDISYGSYKIKEVYYGSELVWSKPSYAILTDGTRVYFEEENTPIGNFCNNLYAFSSNGIKLNSVGYTKNVIKELVFGYSYSNTTSFPSYFLQYYSALEKVDLHVFTNVTSFGVNVFSNCSVLKIIDLSNSKNITHMSSSGILRYTTNLETIIMGTLSPPVSSGSHLLGSSGIEHIYVPCESVQAYKTAYGWNAFADIISCI